ncbi:hypothetical protein KAU19_06980 [Candidatus Parcubacteria bacterium]|nr:hypothetical protein [Candidatus Parcubacteria bacterium]
MIKKSQTFLRNLRDKQLGFALPIVILIISALIAVGTVGYYSYKTSQEAEEFCEDLVEIKVKQVMNKTTDLSPEKLAIEDWKIYQNKEYGFSLNYPKNFQLIKKEITRGSVLASTYIEDPIPFNLVLIQDIYTDSAQTPIINLDIVETNKTINQLLGHIREVINKQAKLLKNPETLYYGAPPPEIKSAETVIIGDLKMTKVVHDIGPGGPNPIFSEYYMPHHEYVFIFSANYSLHCSLRPGIEDCGMTEKEVLPKILSTFKFIEVDEAADREVYRNEEQFIESEATDEKDSEIEEQGAAPNTPIMKNIDTYATPDIPYAIRWMSVGEVDEAVTYTLERDINSSFFNPVTVYIGSSNRFTETLSPSDTTRYFFRVKACNQYGCSSWSSITLLVIEVIEVPTAPNVPTLNDPGDSVKPFIDPAGAIEASYKVSWPPVEGAISYVLQVNSSYSFDAEWNPTWGFHEHNIKGYHDYIGFGVPKVSSPVVFYYRVKAVNDYGASAWSNIVDIEVLPPEPSITISSPNGGEMWKVGEVARISWSSNSVDSVRIKARDANSGNVSLIIEFIASNPHYYDWTIPSDFALGDKYEIEVADLSNPQICDWSYKYFRIVSQSVPFQSITLTSPNGGEVWRVGETHQITWDTVEVDSVKIYIFDPSIFGSGSTNYITPVNISITGTPGRYSWTIPSQLPGGGGNNYKIRIVDASNSQIDDKSDDFFSIIVP